MKRVSTETAQGQSAGRMVRMHAVLTLEALYTISLLKAVVQQHAICPCVIGQCVWRHCLRVSRGFVASCLAAYVGLCQLSFS